MHQLILDLGKSNPLRGVKIKIKIKNLKQNKRTERSGFYLCRSTCQNTARCQIGGVLIIE
jgi:hypothetical protein